jgi:hypothetical protein
MVKHIRLVMHFDKEGDIAIPLLRIEYLYIHLRFSMGILDDPMVVVGRTPFQFLAISY